MSRFIQSLENVPPWAQPMVSAVAVALVIGLVIIMGTASAGLYAVLSPRSAHEDPERARFMLECVYDWERSIDECRAVLRGEDPSPLPAGSSFSATSRWARLGDAREQ